MRQPARVGASGRSPRCTEVEFLGALRDQVGKRRQFVAPRQAVAVLDVRAEGHRAWDTLMASRRAGTKYTRWRAERHSP